MVPNPLISQISGLKSFRIQSYHFQNLGRHVQNGVFIFRIRPLLCKRQNQSGAKTFRIHHESRTIPSSVNLDTVEPRHFELPEETKNRSK